jgi:hypothetical protein
LRRKEGIIREKHNRLSSFNTLLSTTEQPEKKITAYDAKLYGSIYGDDACGNCTDAHAFFKDAKSKAPTPIHYSVTDMDSSEAKKLIEEKGIKAKPYIKVCPIYEDGSVGEDQCKESNNWDPNEWKYLIESANTEENKKKDK